MNILVTGARGLIGRHCIAALRGAGHRVIAGVHRASTLDVDSMPMDFSRDVDIDAWLVRLRGVDVVVNTVGILREHGAQTFDAVHTQAPRALFSACVAAGVKRVIQLSALGADDNATTEFHLSKKAADDFLLALPIASVVVQPSLVFSTEGESTLLFAQMAAAPLLVVPASTKPIQPVALEDLVDGIARLATAQAPPARIAAVGPAPMTLREYLQLLRSRMGLAPGMTLSIPMPLMRLLVRLPGANRIADRDSLDMLERGNHADAAPFKSLLQRNPASAAEFIVPARGAQLRRAAALATWIPALRIAIAAMWIVTGIVSLGFYPVASSLELLARTGLAGTPAYIALFGAAALDIALGIATLLVRRRWIWTAQILLIIGYTVVISLRLPEFWLHPYGPILKNIPLLAAIALMRSLERR